MDAAYIRGYLDGLCSSGSNIFYDDEKGEWFCGDHYKTIALSNDGEILIINGNNKYEVADVDQMYFVESEVYFIIRKAV